MRSVLNKLTPEMFQHLVKQVTELTIDTEERLRGIAAIVFEKAVSEPKFSAIYAQLCHSLKEMNVLSNGSPGVTLNFRLVLLNLCRVEFKKLDEGALTDKVNGHCQRSLGNMRFIGELFKLEMMKDKVVHSCINNLLSNQSEEALECLCCLLTTVGQNLDNDKYLMDEYFYRVRRIIKEGRTSSRIRFLLQDVLDLRKNNWLCWKAEQGPKTIQQVRKQAEMERLRERNIVQQFHAKRDNWHHGGRDLWVHEQQNPAWSHSCPLKELPKEEDVWKPATKRLSEVVRDRREEDLKAAKTQELYRSMHSVLDRLAPEMFGHLMRQVNKFDINTEERLRGIAAIIFEKAISEPRFTTTCAKMCHCLREINAPLTENSRDSLNFRLVLLKLCRMEFKKLDEDHKEEEKQHQRSLSNMKFIGELFKLKMVRKTVMHSCISKMLIMQTDVALECLCCLLSTIGNILDCDEQHLMDGYMHQMEALINKRQLSPQVSLLLQDIVDLRKNYWFPQKTELVDRPICQNSTEVKLEEMQDRTEEQQQLVLEVDSYDVGVPHLALRQSIELQDEGQNTAIIPANHNPEPCQCLFTQAGTKQLEKLDFYTQLPIPRQNGTWRGHGMEQELGRLSSSTLNLLPTLLLSSTFTSSLHIMLHGSNWIPDSAEVKHQFSLSESLGSSSDASQLVVKGPERHALQTLPALPAPANPASALPVTTKDELQKVSAATDMKKMLLCVQQSNSTLQILMVEQSFIESDTTGIVIHRLVKVGPLQPRELRRLRRILHRTQESLLPLTPLLLCTDREVSVPAVPLDRTGVQEVEILFLSENQMKHGLLWAQREEEHHQKLSLPEEEDVSTFVTKKKMSLTWQTVEAQEHQSELQCSASTRVLTVAEGKRSPNKLQQRLISSFNFILYMFLSIGLCIILSFFSILFE
ncbi:eukaryotic translation initiation factor 4 gamma 1-like [Anguilla anguilla]|uniref:eukaryotic translation initiation factor 4 gamma 1-like n=1 Tax=Anguilla anguilla TaxID=7936 RepID=UPI0015B3768E|nr:eukaryotic translation initiation factor 4 gamma 1-like [Anguilla anguilla]